MTATVQYLCRQCEWLLDAEAGAPNAVPCPNCGTDNEITAPSGKAPIKRCASCGHEEMYTQKDFNRATGIAIVVVGAIFVPWTYGLSLLFVTIIDLILYHKLGDVEVCYSCNTVHRGYPHNPSHKPFDLVVYDRHVYGQAPPGAEEGHHD